MATYSQAQQPIAITTPLGADALLLTRLQGTEAISQPFRFRLDLLAPAPVSFDALLGQPATVTIRVSGSPERYVNGVLSSLSEGHQLPGPLGKVTFTRYEAELVPSLWLLGLRTQCRVFQTMTVPDIVQQVLRTEWGLDVQARLTATYPARDYCVQYRESDLAFVSRLLEEEGICYYFQHTSSKHTIVLADSGEGHSDLTGQSQLIFDAAQGGRRAEGRVHGWKKSQKLRPSKVTLRDYSFQLPDSTLEASKPLLAQVQVGQASHALPHDSQNRCEQYDYPGRYAWRFDGVSPEGSNQPAAVQGLFQENQRVAGLRMEEEATQAVRIDGSSVCGHLLPGGTFTLQQHFDGDGKYLLTRVEHTADVESAYLAEVAAENLYENRFEARPAGLPFRPARITPKPTIAGTQTATVVGATGAEVFVERYGRVKVKFHWDRSTDAGPGNSCWLRVGQVWAGKRWGAFFWPRVGHEVVVSFLEGDPDRPLVVGSVYNEKNLPPFDLPEFRSYAGIKSYSITGNPDSPADPMGNYNGVVFNDTIGVEQLELHGERHIHFYGEASHLHMVDGWHRVNVNGFHSHHVGTLPGGSGSGGGDDDSDDSTPYIYNPQTKGGKIGAELTSVCGVDQSIVLGLYSNLYVGDNISVTCNPIGMLSDLGAAIPFATAAGVFTAAGAVAGGAVGVTLGSSTSLTYGTAIGITRSAKTNISELGLWGVKGHMTTGEQVWAATTAACAATLAALTTAGAIEACKSSYDLKQKDWQALFGVSGGLTALLTMVEVFRATYNQVQKGKEAAEAAVLTAGSAALAEIVSNAQVESIKSMAQVFAGFATPDWANKNNCHYVKGHTCEYNDGYRIIGSNEGSMMYGGKTRNQQGVVCAGSDSVNLVCGDLTDGPQAILSSTELKLRVGAVDVGPLVTLKADSATIQVGPPGPAGACLTMNATSIKMTVGTCTFTLDAVNGIFLDQAGYGLSIKDGAFEIVASTLSSMAETTTVDGSQFSIETAEYSNSAALVNMS